MYYEEVIIEGVPLRIPIGLTPPDKRSQGYQYWLQKNTDPVRQHLKATAMSFAPYVGKCSRYLHAFGGLGVTAQIIDGLTGRKNIHTFWERDPVCVEYLKTQYQDVRAVKDSYEELLFEDFEKYDAIILDVTAGTIKALNMVKIWDKIGWWLIPGRFVWNVDSAISKWWLHKEHYLFELGLSLGSFDDYVVGYDMLLRNRGLCIHSLMREPTVIYMLVGEVREQVVTQPVFVP